MMTDRTVQAIARARSILSGVGDPLTGHLAPLAHDLAEAIDELSRPNKIDAARVDRGDWSRAAAATRCSCGEELGLHAMVPGYEWLRRLCDGRFVKL